MTKPICHLRINALELSIHLGWEKEERETPQTIFLDIDIHYPEAPIACQSDKLEDTVCYAKLVDTIRKKIGTRQFHLVEHLSSAIYRIIHPLLPQGTTLRVCILKYPRIDDLSGGVTFSYGDF